MQSTVGSGRARGRTRGMTLAEVEAQAAGANVELTEMSLRCNRTLNDLSISDDSQSGVSESQERMGLILPSLHTRPAHIEDKRGVSGRQIKCITNFIAINAYPEWSTFQYHVSFSPTVDSKSYRIRMMKEHCDVYGQDPIFDGMILYMPHKIAMESLEQCSRHPKTGEKIIITVRLTNELPASNPQCLTIFNLCNRKSFEYLGYRQLGRHYYDPNAMANVQKHRIEIWPGIISAIRLHEEKLLLACEMSHKLLRTDNVAAFLKELYQRFGASFHEKAVQILVGSSVLTRYNNKTYRVDDILWSKHPTEKFTLSDGTEMTYIDYYSKQYSKLIREIDQPLLLSRAKNRGPSGSKGVQDIFLVPELCSMTGLTDEMRADRRVMQDLAQYTRVSPATRVDHGRKYLRNIRENEKANAIFDTWGLQLDADLLEVNARVVSPEPLFFGPKTVNYNPQTADWSRECRSMPLNDAVHLDTWMLVFNEREQPCAEEFYRNIKSLGPPMGMKISEPIICKLSSDRPSDFLDGITDGLSKLTKIQMVVAMVPNDNKTRYDAIKKTCCLDSPVPSQVFRSSSIQKNTVSVCSKILLQMNCKLGGSIWRVDVPMKQVMVIGYDAYSDSTNKGKSVGAAVFSLDPTLTKWYSQCALHGESKQLVSNLTGFCRNGLKKYFERTGFLPDKIFFYRDGVGDGQIPIVYQEELPKIQRAFKDFGTNYNPKLSFIIVTKKVNTRYFERAGSEIRNPAPGTVVDGGVTKPERYDFYLVPQCVRQGTVTPVSYNIIFDESGLKPDHMQRLAYKLCHLYYNWQGTIRLPAPCQYAHKLAFLVGQSLHKPAGEALADKLFFL